MATEEELTGFHAPVLLFALQDDPFFPGEKVIVRAREILSGLEAAELLEDCCHVPPERAFGPLNKRILSFLSVDGAHRVT